MAAKISFQSNLEFTGINASLSRNFALIVKSSARSGETENDAQESFISPFLASFLNGVIQSVNSIFLISGR